MVWEKWRDIVEIRLLAALEIFIQTEKTYYRYYMAVGMNQALFQSKYLGQCRRSNYVQKMIAVANFSAELFTDFDQQIYLLTGIRALRSESNRSS